MSVDKYPRMFLCQMEAIVYLLELILKAYRPCYAGPVNSKHCSRTKLFFLQSAVL